MGVYSELGRCAFNSNVSTGEANMSVQVSQEKFLKGSDIFYVSWVIK